jgi:hypothetical protein
MIVELLVEDYMNGKTVRVDGAIRVPLKQRRRSRRHRRPVERNRRKRHTRSGRLPGGAGSVRQAPPEQLFAGYAAWRASTLGVVGREQNIDTGEIPVTAEVSIGEDDNDDRLALSTVRPVELPEHLRNPAGRSWSNGHRWSSGLSARR